MAYKALVARLTNVRKHPNADRIALGDILSRTVVVGLDAKEGELGVYFEPDGQLSEEFCKVHDLVGYWENGIKVRGGFFDRNRRVKAQRFRKEKSDGFWCPLSYFEYTGFDLAKLTPGMEFDELNKKPICNKYYTRATLAARRKVGLKKRRDVVMFPKHPDTDQLVHRISQIPKDTVIYFTEKVHGTSQRFGYVEVEQLNPWWRRALRLKPKKQWQHLMGTRNVTRLDDDAPGFYGDEEFRYTAQKPLEACTIKGLLFFFEVVGWVDEHKPIMPPHDTSKLGKKDLTKQYGKVMHYNYGCVPGQQKIYLYRVAMVNETGSSVDMSWPEVKNMAEKYGVEATPELRAPMVYDGDADKLLEIATELGSGPSTIDETHIKEGVCLRVEAGLNPAYILKHKSFEFKVMEGIIKDKEDYVDLEEVS